MSRMQLSTVAVAAALALGVAFYLGRTTCMNA